MSHNPFLGISSANKFKASGDWAAFVYLDDQLKTLNVPEVQGIPLSQIVLQSGWSIDAKGVLIPPAPQQNFAMICTGTPGATAISPTVLPLSYGTINLMMSVRFDDENIESAIFYNRHTQTDSILEFGINSDGDLYCTVGAVTIEEVVGWSEFQDFGQWHDVGLQLNDMGTIFFYLNGRTFADQTFSPFTPPTSTEDLISVGSAGVSISWLSMRLHTSTGMLTTETISGFPMPHRRPDHAINCYNFTVVSGVIPDLAIDPTYKCSLGIQQSNATVEAYVMV